MDTDLVRNLVITRLDNGGTLVDFTLNANGVEYQRAWTSDTPVDDQTVREHVQDTAAAMKGYLDAGRNIPVE